MVNRCNFYWLYPYQLAGSAYPGSCLEWLKNEMGIRAIVSLHPLSPQDREKAEELGMQVSSILIEDFTAGTHQQRIKALQAIQTALHHAAPTLVHCQGGLGRTGMILALYLVREEGLSATQAIERIRRLRSGSIETPSQEEAIRNEANAT